MSFAASAANRVASPMRHALRSEFIRHSALVFGASMLANILNYAFNFALSRRLGVVGFAELSALISGLMILAIPSTVLNLMVVKHAATFHAVQDAYRVRRLSQVVLKWVGVAAAIFLVLGMLLRGVAADFLHITDTGAIVLTLVVMALGFVTPAVRGILQGEQDFGRFAISIALESALKLALGVALVYAGFGVVGAMLGWSIGTGIALLYTIWVVLGKHGASGGETLPLGLDLRRLVKTTAGIALAIAVLTVMSFMDVLLVKHYFPAGQAGIYAAVNLTGKVVFFVVGFLPMILLPKAVAKAAKGETAVPLLLQAVGLTIVMSGITLSAFGIEPQRVLSLLAGQAFVSGAPYVFQYDLAMGLLALVTLLVNYNIGVHRFAFLVPLGVVLLGEIAAIAFFHQTLWEVVHILLAGNAAAILGCAVTTGMVQEARRSRLVEASAETAG